MNNRFFNYILPFVFLGCLAFRASAQNISAEAKLQQYTIRIGDQTKLFLSVRQPVKEHVSFPKLADTITGKITVVGANKPDTTVDKNDPGNITVNQSYTITSFDAGTYTIPPFTIGTSAGPIKTNELTLQVETVKVDTTKAIYDIKRPMTVSYGILDWIKDNAIWLAPSLLGLLAIIGLILYLKNRPKKEAVTIQKPKPGLPPHIIAINKLKELRDKKLWQQGEIKQYYVEISDILREYLEKRYVIKAHEQTTDEIFDSLRNIAITAANKNTLRQILTLADLVKFAKEKPLPPENEQCMDNALRFVVETQQAEAANAAEGGAVHV
jgi:hypothetical protein